MIEPWRYRCPEGHVNLRQQTKRREPDEGPMLSGTGYVTERTWYCRTCEAHYEYVIDEKRNGRRYA